MAKQYHINVPDHVDNPERYRAAAQARIAANGRRGKFARWEKECASDPVRQRALEFITQTGEFNSRDHYVEDANGDFIPTARAKQIDTIIRAAGPLYWKLFESVSEWGAPTPKQEQLIIDMLAKAEGRVQERDAKRTEQLSQDRAASQFIGTVGERRAFELTLRMSIDLETQFGLSTIYIFNDDAGNVVVYKGTKYLLNAQGDRLQKGERITFKAATIKAHNERDGVKQTIIARPKEA